MTGKHRKKDRDPAVGVFHGRLDTGKGNKSGELTQDEIDAMESRTERTGRLKPAARMLDEMRGTDPTHKGFER